MRQWFISITLTVLCFGAGMATAQVPDEEFTPVAYEPENYLPPLTFDEKQPGPFQLSIEQRNYSNGSQDLREHRAYMRQEQMRLSQGQGQWTPPIAPLMSSGNDDEDDSFYDQTLFQLMYRFSFE